MNPRLLLAAVLLAAPRLAAACNNLPPVPAGWDGTKWCNAGHTTPKYVVGRIVSHYPHTPDGLKAALPEILLKYPGSKILTGGKGDKIHIPCVGVIDIIKAAGGPGGGEAWQWLVDKDECGSCNPNICDKGNTGGSGSGTGGTGTAATCSFRLPNRFDVVQAVANEDPERFKHSCQERDGEKAWAFLDAVVDRLRQEDKRWGYNCKRGNCNDPSKDVITYYCGPGGTAEGALPVYVMDIIVDHCGSSRPGWTDVSGGPAGTNSGAGWTSRGRFQAQQQLPENISQSLNAIDPAIAAATGAKAPKTATRRPNPGSSGGGAPAPRARRTRLRPQARPNLNTQQDIAPQDVHGGAGDLKDYAQDPPQQ